MTSSPVGTEFDHITKSPSDRRQYLGLQLQNGLKVLLISDPETDLSAAALSVRVGSMCDPWERQGLAHLLEHMLFMGSEKYPTENEYSKFLSQHGGSSNASTSLTGTNFFFDVNSQFLDQALDRFVQFFIHPLIAESSLSREIDAVQSEFVTTIDSDSNRMDRMFQLLSTESHDYRKFTNGNYDTLCGERSTTSLRQDLIDFYHLWYSSSNMSLCVLGKESIEQLKKIVVSKFSQLNDKNVPKPKWEKHPFDDQGLMKLVHMVPVMDIQSVTMRFVYPDDLDYYKSDPSGYLTHLFGLTSKGSLVWELKDRLGLCSCVSVRSFGSDGFGFFELELDFTEQGFGQLDLAMKVVFQYIEFLKRQGPEVYIWDEIRALREVKFRFAGKTHPVAYVTHLSYMLQYFPFEDILSAYNLLDNFNPDLINQLLAYLTPQNCSIVVRSQTFEGQTDMVEEFYKFDYKVHDFPQSLLASLMHNCKVNPNFQLPSPNKFIPTNFEIIKTNPLEPDEMSPIPVLIRKTSDLKAWYFKDHHFETPKVYYGITIANPMVNASPELDNAINLFVTQFKDANLDLINEAENAGISFTISSTSYGIQIQLRGYHHKMDLLLAEVLEKLINFKICPNRFAIEKEDYARTLQDYQTIPPLVLASYYLNLLTCAQIWSIEEKICALEKLTVESIEAMQKRLFSTFAVEMYLHGNLSKVHALKVCDLIDEMMISKLVEPLADHSRPRQIMLDPGCSYKYPISIDNMHGQTNGILIYYEIGFDNIRELALLKLVRKLLDEPFYDQLRTKEQLGYSLAIGTVITSGVYGLSCAIESEFEVDYLEERIEAFMQWAMIHLQKVSSKEFESEKNSLIAKLMEKDKNLAQISYRMWITITSGEYDFTKREKLADIVRELTCGEVLEFYKLHLSQDGEKRRKLVICLENDESVEGMQNRKVENKAGDLDKLKNSTLIKDVIEFKQNKSLYPNVVPKIEI